MTDILAIDPGPLESGWLRWTDGRVVESGVTQNTALLTVVQHLGASSLPQTKLVIEMVASYGMPVGREVFETCVWIGRFMQANDRLGRSPTRLIYRRDVKLHLCGSMRAKDANIWQALIDKLGPVGTKGDPGPLYGVTSHARSALALAVTAAETESL